MASILIRGLDDHVVKRLKSRAKEDGRSLQAEVKRILEQAAEASRLDLEQVRERLERFRRRFRGRQFSDSAALLREDRER